MKYFNLRKENLIAIVTIKHPPANALSSAVLKELSILFDQIETDDHIRVIVLHGEGRFFSAGADIKEFVHVQNGTEFSSLSKDGQQLFERIELFPKPVIAAIHGAALGGGLELALACHMRIVTEDAKLGLPELQLGLIPGFFGTERLPLYIGKSQALELLLTSATITGTDAVQLGLANHAFPDETMLEEVLIIARKCAEKSPISVKAVISLLNGYKVLNYYERMEKEAILFGEVFESADAKEGISAFLEKRTPVFKGE
ncbi:enoyl-CoA hydratase [Metabacillus fastidiosus]|uniref:enoyl-CoA hydratase n=1 Tax=Metabacillus fastidiosus TaxID=1458 RepID=UPI002E24ECAD|nr:enoyl-CoA hydratase [Metabacillus fastidiosus]